jgi:hypothetical protein
VHEQASGLPGAAQQGTDWHAAPILASTSASRACSTPGSSWLAHRPVMAASSVTVNSRPRTDATFSRFRAGFRNDRSWLSTAEPSDAGTLGERPVAPPSVRGADASPVARSSSTM